MSAAPAPHPFGAVPAPRPVGADEVRALLSGAARLVVLDDDPTGTQTVRDVPVLTSWGPDDLAWAFRQHAPGFFVLTNTRSMAPADVERVDREVADAAYAAAGDERIAFASRSDSTLRGWFPLETDVLSAVAAEHGYPVDHLLVAPAYVDAGRVTVGGVHYAVEDGTPVPVGDTEYARDASFGYRSSRLADWIAEKTGGRIAAADVERLGLDRIRRRPLTEADLTAPVIAVDGLTDDDLRGVAVAALRAEADGRHLLYRVGPSFVRARLGQGAAPELDDAHLADIVGGRSGGLVVVGSHVGLTTRQLGALRRDHRPHEVELDVETLEDPSSRDEHLRRTIDRVATAMAAGLTVLSTTRRVATGDGADASLAIARRVSDAVVRVVQEAVARHRPAWVVSKGGITSAEVATRALGIRRARVRGTLLPGIVSLWEAADGPAAGLPYVVFAGNVGRDDSLSRIVGRLVAAEGSSS